jgi:glycosyltransferase involved in cell wall biosynthesis
LRRIFSLIYNQEFERKKIDLAFRCFRLDFRGIVRKVLELCDAVLPNAKTEEEKIKKDFEFKNTSKFHVVPNGVDIHSNYVKSGCFTILGKPMEDFVLCVGRVEDRKNQLALIMALKGTGLKLVLIGATTTKSKSNYYNLCKKEADDDVIFLDWMNRESLASAYHAAKVHALPSWYETPGLVNLEAGLAGCNVVATDKGSTKEYLRDYAWYCDPAKTTSIRRAVLDAFSAKKNPELSKFILTNFSWEQAAEKTLRVYERVLMRNS